MNRYIAYCGLDCEKCDKIKMIINNNNEALNNLKLRGK